MKSYRNAVAALALAFVFSTPAFAGTGILWTEKTPPPPPPSHVNGILWTETADPAPEDTLMEIALGLLQTLTPLL